MKVRRILVGLGLSLVAALAVPALAEAHPGGTDARGGHTCRTDCPSYGLQYGQYHFHHGRAAGAGGGQTQGAGQGSVVTQADCDAGRVQRGGRTLTRAECERLIGQRVGLASTGFEAWLFALGGAICLAGALALRRRRPAPTPG